MTLTKAGIPHDFAFNGKVLRQVMNKTKPTIGKKKDKIPKPTLGASCSC